MIFKTTLGKLRATRIKSKEYNYRHPFTVFGYVFKCTDGHRYICFDTDMPSVRYGNLHAKVTSYIKTYISDHDYDSERECFDPLWSDRIDKNNVMEYQIVQKPFWYRGRVYKLEF